MIKFMTVFVLVIATAGPVSAQTFEPKHVEAQLQKTLELNQQGQWTDAATLSEQILASSQLTDLQRARALYSRTTALARLGDLQLATEHLDELETLLPQLSDKHWLVPETRKLASEIEEYRMGGGRSSPRPRLELPDDGFWKQADDRDRERLAPLCQDFERISRAGGGDAGLLIRNERILLEWRTDRYSYPMTAMSSTKSITAILVGMLCDDGRLSVDQRVGEFFPEWNEGDRARVTIKHLLSHTSGLENRAQRGEKGAGGVSDKNAYVRSLPLDYPVGSRFSYSNEGVQLLSPILDAAAGQPIQTYARERLFAPLGMHNTRFKTDAKGHAWTYADIETTPRDLARIGLLMLDGGVWEGTRIVSEEWVQACIRPSQKHNHSCGYLWWLFDDGFAAHGYLGTDIHVFPESRTIAVRMQRDLDPTGINPGPAYRKSIVERLTR